jgi:sulfate/thiosulfate transport system substrate-binding protein
MRSLMRFPGTDGRQFPAGGILAVVCLFSAQGTALAQASLLSVSHDVSHELYKDFNPAFVADWKAETGGAVAVNRSHGGSSRRCRLSPGSTRTSSR